MKRVLRSALLFLTGAIAGGLLVAVMSGDNSGTTVSPLRAIPTLEDLEAAYEASAGDKTPASEARLSAQIAVAETSDNVAIALRNRLQDVDVKDAKGALQLSLASHFRDRRDILKDAMHRRLFTADPATQKEILIALVKMNSIPSVKDLEKLMHSPDEPVRETAARLAYTHWGGGPAGGEPIFMICLRDSSERIRAQGFDYARYTNMEIREAARGWLRMFLKTVPHDVLDSPKAYEWPADVLACIRYLERAYGIPDITTKGNVKSLRDYAGILVSVTERADAAVLSSAVAPEKSVGP